VTPEEIAAVLAARARALALRPDAEGAGGRLELLAFAIGGARYALPTAQVASVARLGPVTRVPGAPPAVAGVTNHEGTVLLVAELPALLGLAGPLRSAVAAPYLVVVVGQHAPPHGPGDVHDGQAEPLGLVVDDVHEVRVVAEAALHPPAAGGPGAHLTRALTGDGCVVLDGKRLLSEPALTTASP
jgi:chemotaxis signal transduction protein